jgi:hypothetical protein
MHNTVFHLRDGAHSVSDCVSAAAAAELQARGSSGKPLLECAYRQAVVLVDELKRISLPAALMLDVPGICFRTDSSSSSERIS